MFLRLLRRIRFLDHIVAFMLIIINLVPAIDFAPCAHNQIAELGKQGIIHCNFPDDFYAVYWYDDLTDGSSPVIILKPQSSGKSGPGFQNETYDVSSNGSLLISIVTAWYERRYKVIFESNQRSFETYFTYLKVIAYPKDSSPTAKCDDCSISYYHIKGNKTLTCSFHEARPQVHIQWFERFSKEDILLDQQIIDVIGNKDGTYNSSTTVLLMAKDEIPNLISLLVCRATWNASNWKEEKQILLDFSNADTFLNMPNTKLHVEINRRAEVQCEGSSQSLNIWRKIPFRGEPETVGFTSGDSTQIMKLPNIEVSTDGSIVFSHPQINDEGAYACIYIDDKQHSEIKITDLKVLIPPSPPYIQITGCNDAHRPCELQEKDTNELTCGVYGVYPNVTLQWIARDKQQISFFNFQSIIKKHGATSDVLHSAEYKVSEDLLCEEYIQIECQILGPMSRIIRAEASALVIPKSCKKDAIKAAANVPLILLLWNIVIILTLAIIIGTVIHLWRKMRGISNTVVISDNTTTRTDASEEML